MASRELQLIFNRARLDDRLVNELIGLCHGAVADGTINQNEAEYLQKWLIKNSVVSTNPVAAVLLERVNAMLQDGHLSSEESQELLATLMQFIGGEFEPGEITKSTTLPLTTPAPTVHVHNHNFCFTGTFAFGSRADCENLVIGMGGKAGTITRLTDYLVIGYYATDSWIHSSYGRKIERAVELANEGYPIAIIHEDHWLNFVKLR